VHGRRRNALARTVSRHQRLHSVAVQHQANTDADDTLLRLHEAAYSEGVDVADEVRSVLALWLSQRIALDQQQQQQATGNGSNRNSYITTNPLVCAQTMVRTLSNPLLSLDSGEDALLDAFALGFRTITPMAAATAAIWLTHANNAVLEAFERRLRDAATGATTMDSDDNDASESAPDTQPRPFWKSILISVLWRYSNGAQA
jgi:hypothetical protein